MEKSFFFNAVVSDGVPDRSYSAEDIAEREALLLSDGVIGGNSLMAVGNGGNAVYIGAGAAVISGYTYLNTGVMSLNVSDGDGTYDRVDTVALKLDLTARKISAVIVMGYPAASPAAYVPEATATVKYLPIAQFTVAAGTTPAIETEDITDKRVLAGYASVKNDILLVLKEYLGEIDPLDGDEIAGIRRVIDTVKSTAGENTVLCGDGVYRDFPITVREIAAEYTEPGDYTFTPADYPSEGGIYDIEVQGAGGAGGSHNGDGVRGGGGGAGAYVMASRVKIRRDSVAVTVGKGGEGVPGGDGGDGGSSSFGGLIANGGSGGKGGALAAGGIGGAGMFCGGDGADGTPAADGVIYTACGAGGASQYGDGALSVTGDGAMAGAAAESPGSGGSGGTAIAGTYSMPGGNGAGGCVTVYRYVAGAGGEVIL